MATKTAPESVALALNNGCDTNCGNLYPNLLIAHKEGLVTEEAIDRSVKRLMITRLKLGMFDDPELVPYTGIPFEENDSSRHRAFALEVSKQSMVLLKNQNGLLPLDRKKIKNIAVIGPNADSRDALKGNYFGTASQYVTVLEGIREAVGNDARVYYSEGCHLYRNKVQGLAELNDRFGEAIAAAERSDVVVMCLGLDASIEGEEGDASNEYASGDKNHLNLPGLQQQLLEVVYSTGKPVVLVLMAGSALAVTWADENVPAIIQAWYPGAEGGRAVASLIFGDYSPSGKLPVTFYRSTDELPDFHDYSMKNRTYRYMQNEPLYPFGYGLSYGAFEYGPVNLSNFRIKTGESITLSINVKNIGRMDSMETVQLYLRDVEASVETPKWQLRGIRKVYLKCGEQAEVSFELDARAMALINDAGKAVIEPGLFEAYIGGSQPDARSMRLTGAKVSKAEFEVTGPSLELKY